MQHPKFGHISRQNAVNIRKSLESKANDIMLENPDYSSQLYSKVVEWDEYLAVLDVMYAFTKEEEDMMSAGLKVRAIASIKTRTGCGLREAYERVTQAMQQQVLVPETSVSPVMVSEVVENLPTPVVKKRGNPNVALSLIPVEEDMLVSGLKTEAIKNIRHRTGATVRAVREFVNNELDRIAFEQRQHQN